MPIDYSRYPPNWKSEIRPRILDRDKHCCKECGVPNYFEGIRTIEGIVTLDQYMIDHGTMHLAMLEDKYGKGHNKLGVIKIVLTIAHLDHDEENWNVKDDRLAAMCQRCHLRYDSAEKVNRRGKKKYATSLFPLKEENY